MIGGMTDITEKKIYEQSLIVKNQQLAEYAFFNSHKVRAPLARLMSCVNILEIDSEIDKETIEILKAIKLSADELDNEIRDIGNLLSMDSNLGVKKSRD
jgi:signal transduction histidine kinase